eukprot:gene22016-7257_t
MNPTVVQHDHARVHDTWRPVLAGRLLLPTPASVAAAILLAAVLMEAPEEMFDVMEIDLSGGSITIVRTGAFQDLLKLVKIDLTYNDITSIEANAFSNLPQLTTLDLTRNVIASIETNAFSNPPLMTVPKVDPSFWDTDSVAKQYYCQKVTLTEVPTFVNKDVTDINLSGDYYYGRGDRGSITIVRTGAFQDLLKLVTIDLSSNAITLIEANSFSNLAQLTTIDLSNNTITLVGINAFSNLPQLTMLKGVSDNFWQTAGVAEKCVQAQDAQPKCVYDDEEYCQEVTLRKVPTFVNKDVTEIDLSGYDDYTMNSINIVRAGAFQDLLKL